MDANKLLFYETVRMFAGPLISARFRLKVEGRQNIPETGPFLLVSNHRSILDPILLGYAVNNRYVHFGAASWAWEVPVYRELHQWLGAFPITLSGGKDVEKQLSTALNYLDHGEVVGIFPEGGETILEPGKVDKILRFKTGFARIALKARVPVVPATVIGSGERRLPKIPGPVVEKISHAPSGELGFSMITYKRAKIRLGVPLDLGDLCDRPVTKPLLELITSKVHDIVVKLYNGEDLDRFLTGEVPFDFAYERIGGPTKKLL